MIVWICYVSYLIIDLANQGMHLLIQRVFKNQSTRTKNSGYWGAEWPPRDITSWSISSDYDDYEPEMV
jgi:hypothetical protein